MEDLSLKYLVNKCKRNQLFPLQTGTVRSIKTYSCIIRRTGSTDYLIKILFLRQDFNFVSNTENRNQYFSFTKSRTKQESLLTRSRVILPQESPG